MPHLLLPEPHPILPHWDVDFLHAIEDDSFDSVYPQYLRDISPWHWTPAGVARKAAQMLVQTPGARVLDVGCGPGKFCVLGAATTEGHFTGIEQRGELVRVAKDLVARSEIPRVKILHGNMADLDFSSFDAFYIFNPFEENVRQAFQIDDTVPLKPHLYDTYTQLVASRLAGLRLGTRVVTYGGNAGEIPPGYECCRTAFGGQLKLWVHLRHALPDLAS